jgi:hypothetical protein
MRKPTKWDETGVEYYHKDRYGAEIAVKVIDGQLISQTCRHGWIYDYVIGDLREEDQNAPLPYNLQKEWGIR